MGAVGRFLLSPVLALATKKPKPAPQPLAQPVARDRTDSVLADRIAARRGTQENKRTGATGAEPLGGTKTKLGG